MIPGALISLFALLAMLPILPKYDPNDLLKSMRYFFIISAPFSLLGMVSVVIAGIGIQRAPHVFSWPDSLRFGSLLSLLGGTLMLIAGSLIWILILIMTSNLEDHDFRKDADLISIFFWEGVICGALAAAISESATSYRNKKEFARSVIRDYLSPDLDDPIRNPRTVRGIQEALDCASDRQEIPAGAMEYLETIGFVDESKRVTNDAPVLLENFGYF